MAIKINDKELKNIFLYNKKISKVMLNDKQIWPELSNNPFVVDITMTVGVASNVYWQYLGAYDDDFKLLSQGLTNGAHSYSSRPYVIDTSVGGSLADGKTINFFLKTDNTNKPSITSYGGEQGQIGGTVNTPSVLVAYTQVGDRINYTYECDNAIKALAFSPSYLYMANGRYPSAGVGKLEFTFKDVTFTAYDTGTSGSTEDQQRTKEYVEKYANITLSYKQYIMDRLFIFVPDYNTPANSKIYQGWIKYGDNRAKQSDIIYYFVPDLNIFMPANAKTIVENNITDGELKTSWKDEITFTFRQNAKTTYYNLASAEIIWLDGTSTYVNGNDMEIVYNNNYKTVLKNNANQSLVAYLSKNDANYVMAQYGAFAGFVPLNENYYMKLPYSLFYAGNDNVDNELYFKTQGVGFKYFIFCLANWNTPNYNSVIPTSAKINNIELFNEISLANARAFNVIEASAVPGLAPATARLIRCYIYDVVNNKVYQAFRKWTSNKYTDKASFDMKYYVITQLGGINISLNEITLDEIIAKNITNGYIEATGLNSIGITSVAFTGTKQASKAYGVFGRLLPLAEIDGQLKVGVLTKVQVRADSTFGLLKFVDWDTSLTMQVANPAVDSNINLDYVCADDEAIVLCQHISGGYGASYYYTYKLVSAVLPYVAYSHVLTYTTFEYNLIYAKIGAKIEASGGIKKILVIPNVSYYAAGHALIQSGKISTTASFGNKSLSSNDGFATLAGFTLSTDNASTDIIADQTKCFVFDGETGLTTQGNPFLAP